MLDIPKSVAVELIKLIPVSAPRRFHWVRYTFPSILDFSRSILSSNRYHRGTAEAASSPRPTRYCSRSAKDTLIKNDSFVSIQQDAALSDILHSRGKNVALDIAAGVCQLLGTHTMIDTHDILLDDGTLIEVTGDEVGGGSNDLHTAVVSLVIGSGALE